jgi:hypothetical protein
MYSDIATRHGLRATLSLDNKHFCARVEKCVIVLLWLGAAFAVYKLFSFNVDIQTAKPILEFVPCDPSHAPSELLVDMLKRGVMCSTRGQSIAQPCVCCVFGDCWRDVRTVRNSTLTATVVDRPGPVELRRTVPKWMDVCYVGLDGFEYCKLETGPKVSHVLRAIELLRGWPFAGI